MKPIAQTTSLLVAGFALLALATASMPTASAATCLHGGYSWDDHTDTYWHHGSGCYLGTDGIQCYDGYDNHYNNGNPSTEHDEGCYLRFPPAA